MIDLRFKRKYFFMIGKGKVLEARVNYPFLRKIKVGDKVLFFWERHKKTVRITDIRLYKDFDEMLRSEPVESLVPGMSQKEAAEEYNSIYSHEKVRQNQGVRVFAFELL